MQSKKILLLCISGLLILGCISLTFFPAARYAERENRYLAEFPTVTIKSLKEGEVMAGLDTYAAERAPFRAFCRELWSVAELALLQRESHGVILCRDGSLSRRTTMDPALLSRNLAALSRIRNTLGELSLTVAVAPRRIDARSEVLPTLYNGERELAAYRLLPIDALVFLDATKDTQWFRTDHHWTAEGAYAAYVRLGTALGYTPFPESHFSKETVSERFYGTSHAAAGIPGIHPDTLTLWHYEGEEALRVTREGKEAEFEGLYDRSRLSQRDQYAIFLGGNCGITEINRGKEDARPTLLVIKDSFANALLPFLAQHFRILALDPRYRTGDLRELASTADAALLLCGMQTLCNEPFLSALIRA